jgi:hypothetical protein
MKRFITLFIVLFAGIQLISAQEQKPATATTSAKATTVTTATTATAAVESPIKWNETRHDFGQLELNKPGLVVFTFKNTGDKPVVISAARSSCGCTVAEYTKEPVKPGEEGQVKATYNSAREGAFSKTVTVTFDGITDPVTLSLKGTVKAKAAE